ncbi:nitrilase-related carbon-nitrogen hydrolase [Tersicoccus sp. Bi-70]|uniref:nitrilase-related carbon-nitrogen hydrolase n=1 Tax=Tersicoccus sp. Bi-70 TaxID=1897634 RepID=UPI0009785870|nr:nitrilase-related carbon-nitrogen hydrolase [Tersicoccus sp. Bi-70]OMH31451.1 nitrilase [Tersicoccus sp. Bi-70]
MRVAALQERAEPGDPAANLAMIAAAARQAADAGATVLVTPELFLTGYAPERIGASFDAAAIPALREGAASIARDAGIALVVSLPGTDADGALTITATLVDRNGRAALSYTKVHLFGPDEAAVFRPAEEAPGVVELDGVPTSLLICYDVEFPEAVRAAADAGAELVLVPTALSAGFEAVPQVLLRARALESQVALVYANHCGTEDGLDFLGHSVVVGPDGALLAEADAGTALLVADVPDDAVRRARAAVPYLAERRTDLYRRWHEDASAAGPASQ